MVEMLADRWWVSSEVWVILAWVSLVAWFRWWVWWPLLASIGLMVCVCVCGSDDGLCLCVCVVMAQTHIHQIKPTSQIKQTQKQNPHPKSNKPKSKTHHYRPIERNPMVGDSDDVVDGTTSSVVWCGVVIRPWVVVDVVGRVHVAVLVDSDLRV